MSYLKHLHFLFAHISISFFIHTSDFMLNYKMVIQVILCMVLSLSRYAGHWNLELLT